MKVARTYTIDHNIIEKMQNLNASDLINRLLIEHFQAFSPNNSRLDEKKALIKNILDKKKRLIKKLSLSRNGKPSISITILRLGLKLGSKLRQILKLGNTSETETLKSQHNLSCEATR